MAALGGELRGDPERRVHTVGSLATAGSAALGFLANSRYRSLLSTTRAGCVILREKDASGCQTAAIVTADPYVYYARAAELVLPPTLVKPGIHPGASIEPDAEIAADAWVGPRVVVGAGACIGPRVYLGPGCVVGDGVEIGARTRLSANVTILARAHIGQDCVLHPGVVIGADGFGIALDGKQWLKVPQLGSVVIGDRVEIGANTTIDRGTIEDTVIADGVKLDNLIQIGHNVRIGTDTVIAACTGISGTTTVGARCMIAGQVGIAGHLEIADGSIITGKTFVNHSIHSAGRYSGGLPMDESGRWRRNSARFKSLDELARRIARLEREDKDTK